MRAIICGALIALSITAANAEEDFNITSYMLPQCKGAIESDGGNFTQGFCAGIVFGAATVVSASPKLNGLCIEIPNGVTPKQMVSAGVRYIEARPEKMQEPFTTSTVMALLDAWPCRQ